MSTLSLRKIKHDSSAVDNITLDSNGNVGINKTTPRATTGFNSVSLNGTDGSEIWFDANNVAATRLSGTANETRITAQASGSVITMFTGATERVRVDNSGRVTMPYQPAFMVTGDSRAAYAAGTDFIYGTVRFNVGGHYSTSNGRFTAPIAGRYAFYANCMGDATDARMMTRIVINGTDYHQGSSSSNGSQYQDSKLFVLAQLNAGDYVYVRNVGNKSTYDFNQLEQWFCGYLVS